jgi:hypothetical protein
MKKPIAKVVGENGNIFNLIAICKRVLYNAGKEDDFKEMQKRIYSDAKSYEESLRIMSEYCELR